MSDVFALDTKGEMALEEDARRHPATPDSLDIPAWQGLGAQSKQFMVQSARAGRSAGIVASGTLGPALDWAAGAGDRLGDSLFKSEEQRSLDAMIGIGPRKQTAISDAMFRATEQWGDSAVDYWTPDAASAGTAAQVMGGVFNVAGAIPQIIGAPELFLLNAATDPGVDVIQEGGSTGAALGTAAVSLGVNAVGMRLPAAWGNSLAARVGTGTGANLALGVGQDAATREILKADGLEEYADAFDPLNAQSRTIDLLMGAVFGVKAHMDAAPVVPRSAKDAILATSNADHFANQTMPGKPRSPDASVRHQEALEQAIQQIITDSEVAVQVRADDFDLRPALRPAPAIDGYEQILVALESGGRADAKAASSSATGLHQFTNATWLRTVKAAAPAWASGLTDTEVLALRTDPAKSADMERVLRAENAGALARAGAPVNAWTLYAAHHFGAAGGVKFARAADSTPMAEILSAGQIKANPYLKGKTKAEAVANWEGRVRRSGIRPDGTSVDTNEAGQALRRRLVDDPEALAREYAALEDSAGGTVLNTDTARELSPEYLADRTRSADVHEAASDTIKEIYAAKLAAPTPAGMDPVVMFTAGGTGAGKTTAIQGLGDAFGRPEIVYDTNMNTLSSAMKKVEQALDAGRQVRIAYVYRDPVEALTGGAIPRAQRQAKKHGTGRTVPIEEHAKTHAGVRDVMEAVAERFRDDPRVELMAIDNRYGKGKAVFADLAELPVVEQNSLRENLRTALDEARAGGLEESIYRGFLAEGRAQAAPEVGAGSARQPEQENGRAAVTPEPRPGADQGAPDALQRTALETLDARPDLMVMDDDGVMRPASEFLAEGQRDIADAETETRAIDTAANCMLRSST